MDGQRRHEAIEYVYDRCSLTLITNGVARNGEACDQCCRATVADGGSGDLVAWLCGCRDERGPRPSSGAAVPVTAGIVRAEDVPVFLHGIGTVQAYNAVQSRPGSTARSSRSTSTRARRSRPATRCSRSIRGPTRRRSTRPMPPSRRTRRNSPARQLDLERYEAARHAASRPARAYDQQKALVGQLEASIKGDQAQIDTAKLNLDYADIRSPIDGRHGRAAGRYRQSRPCRATTLPLVTHHPAEARSSSVSRCRRTRSRRSAQTRQKAPLVVSRLSAATTRRCWPRAS